MSTTTRRGSRLIQGATLQTANIFLQAVIAFFLMPYLVRHLGDEGYGIWTLATAIIGYYGMLELGLGAAVGRFVAKSLGSGASEERARIIGTAFFLFVGLGIMALLVTVLVASNVQWLVDGTKEEIALFSTLILVLGGTISLSFPLRVFGGVLTAHLRYDLITYVTIALTIPRVAAIVAAIEMGYGLLEITAVVAIGTLAREVVLGFLSYRIEKVNPANPKLFYRKEVGRLLDYSLYILLSGIATTLKSRIDVFVVAKFISLAAVTHYAIAARLVEHAVQLISKSVQTISPVFSQDEGRGDYEGIRRKVLLTTTISVVMTVGLTGTICLYGAPFISRWMGPDYLDAYELLLVLMVPRALGLAQTPLFSVLYAISKHKVAAVVNVAEGVANLALSLILVQEFGMMGVALGTLIPMVVTTLLVYPIYMCHVLDLPLLKYFGHLLGKISLAALALGLGYLCFHRLAGPSYLDLAVAAGGTLAVYAVVSLPLSFSSEQRRYLLSFLRPAATAS